MLPKVYGGRLAAEVRTPVDEKFSSIELVGELDFALTLLMRRHERDEEIRESDIGGGGEGEYQKDAVARSGVKAEQG